MPRRKFRETVPKIVIIRKSLPVFVSLLVLGLVLFQPGCARFGSSELLQRYPAAATGYFIWAHSDIQPLSTQDRGYYEIAIADVQANFRNVPLAIVAGDLVQRRDSASVYRWILDLQSRTNIPRWLMIAGNHEWRDIGLYKEKIGTPLRYTATWGNVVFIMMSNEKPGRRTYISDDTFAWWKQQVVNNQDKILVTVTHASLERSGLLAAPLHRLQIIDSERFRDVLKQYHMDVWISGHSHFPGYLPRMHHRNRRLNNTLFVDLGAIRKDIMTLVESRLFHFEEGSDQVALYYRDHERERFTHRRTFEMRHPFTKYPERR